MLISSAGDPLDAWVRAERRLGQGTRDYSSRAADSDASPGYRPDSAAGSFRLPTRLVPPAAARVLAPAARRGDLAAYQKPGHLVIPLHPDAYRALDRESRAAWDSWPEGPGISAAPLANTRTVLALGNEQEPGMRRHFLKLHFPGTLSRFRRPLGEPEIAHHLMVARELEESGFPVLSDLAGIVYHGGPGTPWGFLMRDPCQVLAPGSLVVPAFALYGRDRLRPSDPVLLRQLISLSGIGAEAYICEYLIRPAIRLWVQAALSGGFLLAMHGQNVLYRASLPAGTGQVLYRGCSVYVDESLRGKQDFSAAGAHRKVIPSSGQRRSPAVRSLVYDSFLGHHLLDYIDRLATADLGVAPGRLAAAGRDEYKRSGGRQIDMPPTVHYYRDDPAPRDDRETEIEDTGVTPRWR